MISRGNTTVPVVNVAPRVESPETPSHLLAEKMCCPGNAAHNCDTIVPAQLVDSRGRGTGARERVPGVNGGEHVHGGELAGDCVAGEGGGVCVGRVLCGVRVGRVV